MSIRNKTGTKKGSAQERGREYGHDESSMKKEKKFETQRGRRHNT